MTIAVQPKANSSARALWYVAPGKAELRGATIGDRKPDEVLVRSLYSGLSRGTERLIFEGRVPESEWGRMKAPAQEGEFPFPVKYGYATVGEVEEGPAGLKGKKVFALYPHQERFVVSADKVFPVPDNVPAKRATLAANMETALNILWDGNAQPGDRIAIVGGGIVGTLVASLASRLPGAEVTLVDIDPSREKTAKAVGASFALPGNAPMEADLVIHTTASAAGPDARAQTGWRRSHHRRSKLVRRQHGQCAPGRLLSLPPPAANLKPGRQYLRVTGQALEYAAAA